MHGFLKKWEIFTLSFLRNVKGKVFENLKVCSKYSYHLHHQAQASQLDLRCQLHSCNNFRPRSLHSSHQLQLIVGRNCGHHELSVKLRLMLDDELHASGAHDFPGLFQSDYIIILNYLSWLSTLSVLCFKRLRRIV